MKIIIILISFNFIFSQNTISSESKIKDIRKKYYAIQNNLDKFELIETPDIAVTRDLRDSTYSMESSEIVHLAIVHMKRYYNNNILIKAVVNFDAAYTDLISEYYFNSNGLFFVFKSETTYDKMKQSKGVKSQLVENRYYIFNKKVIRWLNSTEGNLQPSTELETMLNNDAEVYKSY